MTPEHLLANTTGCNFRVTALSLALAAGVPADAGLRHPDGTADGALPAGPG
jgi:hypothetical protein